MTAAKALLTLGTAGLLAVPSAALPGKPKEPGGDAMAFQLTSSAFGNQQMIPSQYTCDGRDASPPLKWTDPPQGTKSFALVNDDPDAPAGDWVHWVVYDIPASARELPENVLKSGQLESGARQGRNDFGKTGYGGPCPPSGVHRYRFKLYALDGVVNLPVGTTKEQLLRGIEGHVLAEAQLMGKYGRKK